MAVQICFELPESVFSALRSTPDEFVKEMRVTAAAKWYEMGIISQAKASELAGLTRSEFIQALGRFKISPFQETLEEITRETE